MIIRFDSKIYSRFDRCKKTTKNIDDCTAILIHFTYHVDTTLVHSIVFGQRSGSLDEFAVLRKD
jgi:hypothetical protein